MSFMKKQETIRDNFISEVFNEFESFVSGLKTFHIVGNKINLIGRYF